jgi:hypothetical protein
LALGNLKKAKSFVELVPKCQKICTDMEAYNDTTYRPELIEQTEQRTKTDLVANSYLPSALKGPNTSILSVLGDGNCLPRCGSLVCFGVESGHIEMRGRIIVELVLHEHLYLQDSYLSDGFVPRKNESCSKMFAMFSEEYIPGDELNKKTIQTLYRKEVRKLVKTGTFMGVWQIFSMASVMGCKVRSAYPDHCTGVVHRNLNRVIHPRILRTQGEAACILWTSNRGDVGKKSALWSRNHFVPVVNPQFGAPASSDVQQTPTPTNRPHFIQ